MQTKPQISPDERSALNNLADELERITVPALNGPDAKLIADVNAGLIKTMAAEIRRRTA